MERCQNVGCLKEEICDVLSEVLDGVGLGQRRFDGVLSLCRLHHRGHNPIPQEEEELMNTEVLWKLFDGLTIEVLYDLFHATAWILAVVALARLRK